MNKNFYSVCLIDDQSEELIMIELFIARLPYLKVLFKETDPMRALRRIEEETPDILFLDIQMPNLDGISLYRSLSYKPTLIICSGHAHYAYESSQLDAVAYLPKWLAFEDFEMFMLRAVARVDRVQYPYPITDSITLTGANMRGTKINIPIDSIIHVEIMDKVTTFHCEDFDRQAKVTMEALETLLPVSHFVRTHKSHIVNLSKVKEYNQTRILLEGFDGIVPIGRSYLPKIWERLKQQFE